MPWGRDSPIGFGAWGWGGRWFDKKNLIQTLDN